MPRQVQTERRQSVTYSQNFLRSSRLVGRLLERSSIGPHDLVYEIGPGRGIITERLVRHGCAVVAIERDPLLARRLQRRFAGLPRIRIEAGDFLDARLPGRPYKVFANLPFRCTAAILTKLTTAHASPNDAYCIVQKEAAERFLGWPRETLCSVLLKPWFEPSILHRFRRSDFTPAPGVDVVMLRLNKRGPPLLRDVEAQPFRDFATAVFMAWQPTVGDALKSVFGRRGIQTLDHRMSLPLCLPPSALHFEQWLALFFALDQMQSGMLVAGSGGAEQRLRRQQAGLHKEHRTRVRRGVRTAGRVAL